MRRILLEGLARGALTEPPPSADDATLAELAAKVDGAARRRLGRSLSIRQVDAGPATAANWKSMRSITPSTTSNVSACALSPHHATPTCSW